MFQTEKALSWILKGGLLLTPFLVLVVTRSLYFPFITGKNFVFRILVELLAVVWVWAALKFPRFRPRSSPLAWAVIAFIAVMGLATAFSLSPYHSFWSGFERMEGYIGLLHLFLYFLLLTSVFRTQRDWSVFFHTSLAASLIISFYALLQLSGQLTIHQGGTRVDATFGNATYLAAYLLFHLFILAWLFLKTNERWWRTAYGAAFILELVILYYTATRGAILGFFGGLALLAVLLAILERGAVRKFALAGLGVVVLVPIAFFLIRNTDFVRESEILTRFATISPSETTTQARFTIWKMALAGWWERPVLGWGQESFVYIFSKHYDPSLWRQEPWFDRAHNVFLDWLTAGGILGLASYLAMYATAGWLLWRALRTGVLGSASFAAVSSLLAAHFFQNLFVFDNLTSWLLFFAVLGYVHTTARREPEAADAGAPRQRSRRGTAASVLLTRLHLGITALAAVVLAFSLYFSVITPVRAAKSILNTLKTLQTHPPAGLVDELTDEFRRGIARETFGTTELREQLSQVAIQVAQNPGLADQDKRKFLEFAITELEAQRREAPTDVRAMAFLSTLYATAGRPADAVQTVNDALAVSKRRQHFYFIAAEAYLNAGRIEEALSALRTAYDLAPEYPEAVVNLAVALILAGRGEEAELLLERHTGSRSPAQERYALAYTNAGSFAKAARIWEALAAASPNDPHLHASLGVALARSGRPEEGIRAIERAIELEPRFAAQGQAIIQGIRSGEIQ